MHVVFMGTPEFAVPSLRALTTEHDVLGAFTRPDAVRGRGRTPVPSPVKEEARALGIPVYEPRTLRDPETHDELRALGPDLVAIAAFGLILPREVLEIPRLGVLNVHASLLPRWRGAAPVARAILAGDETTGVSIMRVEEGLDTGPYSVVAEVAVGDRGVDDLTSELADIGAYALLEAVRGLESGSLRWVEQDEALATYAGKVTAEELALAPSLTVDDAWRRVRASTDSATSAATVDGSRVRVLEASPFERDSAGLDPGRVTIVRAGPVLALADGGLLLEKVVPEGRKAMDGAAWARGARLGDDVRWDRP